MAKLVGIRKEEHGFVSLTVLVVTLLCMTLAGFVLTNAKAQLAHTLQTEQILRADLLAQDALETAKQTLCTNKKWRGTSTWMVRRDGNCQYVIQDDPQLPLTATCKIKDPGGVMITGIGKATDGSFQKLVIWYDPTTYKTYMYIHA